MIATAEARHRAYALLGRLLVEGLTDATRPVVEALPQLNDAVSREDSEAWAVEHERFSRSVFAYESVFRGDDALMGGPLTGAVRASYERSGLGSNRLDTEPDHLGLELAHLAHLCAAERDALTDEHPVDKIRELQRAFLRDHVLTWVPAVLATLVRTGPPLYAQIGQLTAQVLGDHASSLGIALAVVEDPVLDVLSDPSTRLRDVADHLLRPSRSGWFLSAQTLGRLAERADLPAGFGPRKKQLEGLLFASADHQQAPALLGTMVAEAAGWQDAYTQLEGLGLDVDTWRARLKRTEQMLRKMADLVAS